MVSGSPRCPRTASLAGFNGEEATGDTPPVAIESALARFGIPWVSLGGEPAQAGGFQVKPAYADVIDDELARSFVPRPSRHQ